MSRNKPNGQPAESAEEWGRRQAEAAPLCSDAMWREVNAILRIKIVEPPKDGAVNDSQADAQHRPDNEAA